jgi:hypothetical protein
VGFLTTLGDVAFFICLPAGNYLKRLDDAAVCLSEIKRLTTAASRSRQIAISSPSERPIRNAKRERNEIQDARKTFANGFAQFGVEA